MNFRELRASAAAAAGSIHCMNGDEQLAAGAAGAAGKNDGERRKYIASSRPGQEYVIIFGVSPPPLPFIEGQ